MLGQANYWLTKRQLTRRSVLTSAAGGLGITCLALAGCGDHHSTPATGKAGPGFSALGTPTTPNAGATVQPKRGGTLRAAGLPGDDIWDPHTSTTNAGIFWNLIGNQALRLSVDATALQPELVQKWEIPGDGTEIVLHARTDAPWHNKPPTNGRRFNADDLAFNLMRIAGKYDPAHSDLYQRRSTLPNLDTAQAIDDTTVRVRLTAPHAGFLNGTTDFRNSLVPHDYVDKGGDFKALTALIGTGPWTIESGDLTTKVIFKPMPSWDSDKPYLNSVELVAYSDRLALQTAFAKGDIQVLERLSAAERQAVHKLSADVREERAVHHHYQLTRFNVSKPPFNDLRIRKAIFLVIDYGAIADTSFGSGYWDYTGPLGSFPEAIAPSDVAKLPGYNPSTKDADRKAATDLLAAAGLPNGRGLSFKLLPAGTSGAAYDQAIRVRDYVKSVWPDLDVVMDIPADTTTFQLRQAKGDFDYLSYTSGGAPDGIIELEGNYGSSGSRNYGRYSDQTVDAQLTKAASQLNFNERQTTLLDVQHRLIDQVASLIKLNQDLAVVYFSKAVKGAENFIRRSSTETYDNKFNYKNVWFDSA